MGKGEREEEEEEEEEEVSKSRMRVLFRTRRMQSGRLEYKYASRYIYHRAPSLLWTALHGNAPPCRHLVQSLYMTRNNGILCRRTRQSSSR
jgi:hypothetical protein